jgi:CO/xanthine dehydrogenase FAD-binding subunit
VRVRAGRVRPRLVIDLKRVDGLRSEISASDSSLRIGALTRMGDIITDDRIRRHFPALAEAAGVVGSVQIRNRATLPATSATLLPPPIPPPPSSSMTPWPNLAGLHAAAASPSHRVAALRNR